MTLDVGAASALVGSIAVAVVAWGAWLSVGAARLGPEWAYSALTTWRQMPAVVFAVGAILLVVGRPLWVGITVLYIGAVSGWLLRTVRRRLDFVREAYGSLEGPSDTTEGQARRTGTYLLAGALFLAVIGLWDVSMRGWLGVFGVVLAVVLGVAGFMMRR